VFKTGFQFKVLKLNDSMKVTSSVDTDMLV